MRPEDIDFGVYEGDWQRETSRRRVIGFYEGEAYFTKTKMPYLTYQTELPNFGTISNPKSCQVRCFASWAKRKIS
jgi:hypothetical protein